MSTFQFSSEMEQSPAQGRKYRSRKHRPCDACRRRRIGCIKDAGSDNCITCKVRNINCSYNEEPLKKKKKSIPSPEAPTEPIRRLEVPSGLPDPDSFRNDVKEEIEVSVDNNVPKPLENHDGRTNLFAGFSGDLDPWLLRTLNNRNILTPNYRTPCQNSPVYFSSYPTEYLDSIPDKYSCDKINSVVYPHQRDLIGVFFDHISPSLPFINKIQFKNDRTCSVLLAVIYAKGIYELNRRSPAPEKKLIRSLLVLCDFALRSLPLEFGSATLQIVQAFLLNHQLDPIVIRDANMPHSWMFTACLVALCLHLGLNLDPASWDLPRWEKRLRRRLWWCAYVEDKWSSLGLSRPSNIQDEYFTVSAVTEDDFIDNEDSDVLGNHKDPQVQGIRIFIAMIHLTKVLSRLLKSFYCMQNVFNKKPLEETMSIGYHIIYEADSIERIYFPKEKPPVFLLGSLLSLKLAKVTIIMCSCKNILYNDSEKAFSSIKDLAFDTANNYVTELGDVGLSQLNSNWWSYSRLNFSLVGVAILAFYLASEKEPENHLWSKLAHDYKERLASISKMSSVSKLALLRYEYLLSRIEAGEVEIQENNHQIPVYNHEESFGKYDIKFIDRMPDFTEEDDFFMEWLKNNESELLNNLSERCV